MKKENKIILGVSLGVCLLVWLICPYIDNPKPAPTPSKKTIQVIVDDRGKEIGKIITRGE